MTSTEEIMEIVTQRNPEQKEFHQAVREVLESIEPAVKKNPEFTRAKILERMVEPERQVMFRAHVQRHAKWLPGFHSL